MTTRRVVRERIDPRLTAALFSNYRSPVDAVLELIDNAVDSRLPGREGPDGQLTLEAAERAATEAPTETPASKGAADVEPPAPRTPRTGAGSGPGRAIGEIVVRALDPRLRSAMVIEDGVRRVVINSRYPLYEVRKGVTCGTSSRPRCARFA